MQRFIMSTITNAWLGPLTDPKYLKPYAIKFTMAGRERTWELAKAFDSVAILIYNKQREVFVLVKQFRPAVFCKSEAASQLPWNPATPPSNEFSTELGKTWELCAGLVDRDEPPADIAAAEVEEETGYKVPVSSLTMITKCCNGVGTSGALQYLYYIEVDDSMRVSQGGGLVEEGEIVEVVEIPKADIEKFAFDETKQKPSGCMFAIMWWLNKYSPK